MCHFRMKIPNYVPGQEILNEGSYVDLNVDFPGEVLRVSYLVTLRGGTPSF